MKIVYKVIGLFLILSIFLASIAGEMQAKGKDRLLNKKDLFCVKVTDNEWFNCDECEGGEWGICRNDYGLIAKNVKKVWTAGWGDNVFISRKKKYIQEVDFSHWTENGNTRYRTSLVSKDAVEFYPLYGNELIWKNSKGEYFHSGTTLDENGKINGVVKNERVPELDGVKKCWCGYEMFAYIKNNSLKLGLPIPGYAGQTEETGEIKTYFEGKGDQITEVVVSSGNEMDFANGIFVLMKDGSVWGMGNVRYKMVGKRGTAEQFSKIIAKDVEHIQAGTDRVAMLKKDKSLWIWGRTMQKENGKYSEKPVKVAGNVKEFSFSDCYLLMLKTNHTAYGLGGSGSVKIFTKSYPKKWYAKPIQLMKNVKHVYASAVIGRTMLLTRENELYWTGYICKYPLYAVWAEGKKWDMPKYYTSQNLYNKFGSKDKFWKEIGLQ